MADRRVDIHDIDFNELCEAIDKCQGNVYLTTDEGDRLNLKSKLCQLLGLSKLLTCGHIAEAKLICENPDDESLLFRYNLYRHFA